MYNNQDPNRGLPAGQDLLSAVVSQSAIDTDQLLNDDDFAGLVDMSDITISDDILVQTVQGETYQVPQPVVGSTVEIETSSATYDTGADQIANMHLGSDIMMMEDVTGSNMMQQVEMIAGTSQMVTHQEVYETPKQVQQQQQQVQLMQQPQVQNPGPRMSVMTTSYMSKHTSPSQIMIQAPSVQSTATKTVQVLNYPKQTLATSQPQQMVSHPVAIKQTSQPQVTTQQSHSQPPIFVTNQMHGGIPSNISYILPSGATGQLGKTTQTLAVKGASTATLVINQSPGVTSRAGTSTAGQLQSTNLKLVHTSQGQQLILAAPYKPPTSSAVAQKSTAIAIKHAPVTGQKSVPVQISGQSTTAGQQQQLIILSSPVKQNPSQGASSSAKAPTFAIPGMKMVHLPSTSKLQQIAPAPAPAQALKTTQRVLAPAPMRGPIVSIAGGTKPIQTIVHPGAKNVQYISFVPIPGGSGTQVTTPHPIATSSSSGQTSRYVPLKPQTVAPKQIITTGSAGQTLKPNMFHMTAAGLTGGSGAQKVLLSTPNTIKIATSLAGQMGQAKLAATSTAAGKPTSIWMLPKPQQIIKMEGGMQGAGPHGTTTIQLQATNKPIITGGMGMGIGPSGISAAVAASKFVPIAPHPYQAGGMKVEETKMTQIVKLPSLLPLDPMEESRRKPCNCTRSQCLKLYCDCFANGEFCNNCNCVSCCNNLTHEEIRQKAIRLCLDRNPNAFHPKIGQQATHGDGERKHTKGCCCKRSGCLKNYCECYEAKILCGAKCKCVGCKNFEESTERKTLMYLADAAEVRSVQQSYTNKVQIWGSDLKLKLPVKVKSDCHPFNIFTDEILEATASCMLAQGEEGEFESYTEDNVQSLILEQFGECLSQILNMAANENDDDWSDEGEDKPSLMAARAAATASESKSAVEVTERGK